MFEKYLQNLLFVLKSIECSDYAAPLLVAQGVEQVVANLVDTRNNGKKIIWVGNGGSAAIASHSAADYFRTGNIKTQSFLDGSLLTCMGNDFGYAEVFSKPVELYAETGDLLIAISSSGRSANILKAAQTAADKGCFVITLSGFDNDNPLRKLGGINFYVASHEYGAVELTHSVLCHSFLDIYMLQNQMQ